MKLLGHIFLHGIMANIGVRRLAVVLLRDLRVH
jgi:hypothetical protein